MIILYYLRGTMNRKITFILFCLLLLPLSLAAQAVAQLPKKVHDFGEVSAAVDSVTCVFDIVNVGNEPLRIEGIYLKCGCTHATYSKEEVPAGGKGQVYVTFYPKNRDGLYLKSIYVYTNTRPRKNVLRIKAMVVPAKGN